MFSLLLMRLISRGENQYRYSWVGVGTRRWPSLTLIEEYIQMCPPWQGEHLDQRLVTLLQVLSHLGKFIFREHPEAPLGRLPEIGSHGGYVVSESP